MNKYRWLILLFCHSVLADYDSLFTGKGVFDTEKERIEYQKEWCDTTFDYYTRFDDAAIELESYSINMHRVEDYLVYRLVAEDQHDDLARYCFYPEE